MAGSKEEDEGGASRHDALTNPASLRARSFLPPLLWAAFFWLYIVVSSGAESQTFHILVRGKGAVPYASAITLLSPSADVQLFLAVSAMVLLGHFVLFGNDLAKDPRALLASLGFAISLAAFEITSLPLLIPLLGLAFIILVALDARRASDVTGLSVGRILSYFAVFAAAALASLALASSARWVIAGFDGAVPPAGWDWWPAYVGLQLLGLLEPILPRVALFFFFAWVLRLAVAPFWGKRSSWAADRGETGEAQSPTAGGPPSLRLPLALLAVAILLAIFVGAYAYLPAINPSSALIGVDVSSCYSHILDSLPVSGPCGTSAHAYEIERLGAIVVLKGFAWMTGSNDAALRVAPAVLGVFLAVSTYVLVSEGTGDKLTAGVSALLASVSPEVVAGINGGFIANWLAIGVAFLFFTALLRALRTRRLTYALLTFAIFSALLFIHPWTWAVTFVILAAYLSLSLLESALAREIRSKRLEALMLLSLIAAGIVVDALRSSLPMHSGFEVAYSTLLPAINSTNVFGVVGNLRYTFTMILLGAFADPAWFVLGAVGVISIPSLRGRFGKLLFTWIAVMSLGVILVGPLHTLQSRVIYDVPMHIFAAVGVVAIIRLFTEHLQDGTRSGRVTAALVTALSIVGVVGLLLGLALDNVGYLYP